MVETQELDVLKDIPGYKAILKALIKSQIQHLVEQLSSHTDEECVLLSASLSDGSLSHLGSDFGKQFLESHDDVKKQFLGFCFEKQLSTPASTSESPTSYDDPGSMTEIKPKRQRFGKASAAARQAALPYMDNRINKQSHANIKQMHDSGANITASRSPATKTPTHTSAFGSTISYSETNQNVAEDENISSDSYRMEAGMEFDVNAGEIAKTTGSQLDQFVNNGMQASTPVKGSHENQEPSNDGRVVVKVEPGSNEGSDLEITGVDVGQKEDANYGYWNQSSAGDTSFDTQDSGHASHPIGTGEVKATFLSERVPPVDSIARDGLSTFIVKLGACFYQCNVCSKTSGSYQDAVRHLRTHTGEKPYACDWCSSAFSRKSSLYRHLRAVHTKAVDGVPVVPTPKKTNHSSRSNKTQRLKETPTSNEAQMSNELMNTEDYGTDDVKREKPDGDQMKHEDLMKNDDTNEASVTKSDED